MTPVGVEAGCRPCGVHVEAPYQRSVTASSRLADRGRSYRRCRCIQSARPKSARAVVVEDGVVVADAYPHRASPRPATPQHQHPHTPAVGPGSAARRREQQMLDDVHGEDLVVTGHRRRHGGHGAHRSLQQKTSRAPDRADARARAGGTSGAHAPRPVPAAVTRPSRNPFFGMAP